MPLRLILPQSSAFGELEPAGAASSPEIFPSASHFTDVTRRHITFPVLLLSILLPFVRVLLRAADPATLQITLEEGDGLTYPLGSRATLAALPFG